jgi:thioredoxin-dependent peroxiredoxin
MVGPIIDLGKASKGRHMGIAEGSKAPVFTLARDGGGSVSLADFAGGKLVLFFYPRADTPGCTRESVDFSKLRVEFQQARTQILGVSADPLKAQDAFKRKYELTITLGSDPTHAILEAYGAWGEKSMYGKRFMGILRTTVLIGADGRIARIWPKVKVPGHAEEVLAAARAL